MNKNFKIGIIGCGNMGKAIASVHRGVIVFDIDESKIKHLLKKYKAKAALDNKDLARHSNVIIIAVKPQDIDVVLDKISEGIKAYKKNKILIISIAAGINTGYIEKKTGSKVKVIRAMPNMPAAIGEGITALTKGQFANDRDLGIAKNIFKALGPTIEIPKENLMDVVTALSGSGPAYLFFIFCAMLGAAEGLGLDKKTANMLIYQTIIGSMDLLDENKFDAESLIAKIASKGGTTEAALKVFKDKKLNEIILQGIIAAWKRAQELSRR